MRSSLSAMHSVEGRASAAPSHCKNSDCAVGEGNSLATQAIFEQASQLGVAEGHKDQALLAPLA